MVVHNAYARSNEDIEWVDHVLHRRSPRMIQKHQEERNPGQSRPALPLSTGLQELYRYTDLCDRQWKNSARTHASCEA